MDCQPNPAARGWRRRPRLGIRGLIAAVVVIGGALGWFLRSERAQREAVAEIRRAGGFVMYEPFWRDNFVSANREPWQPGSVVNAIGIDYFAHPSEVEFYGKGADPDLLAVGRLTKVVRLSLADSTVTDLGLTHIKSSKNLAFLHLVNSQVTGAGLVHLTGLVNLSELSLSDSRVTDDGLAHLSGLTRLSKLDLWDTRVGDDGLAHLISLSELSDLDLTRTDVTDAGISHLDGMKNLSRVDLWDTRASAGGVRQWKARRQQRLTINR
jgi:hypothetical protein